MVPDCPDPSPGSGGTKRKELVDHPRTKLFHDLVTSTTSRESLNPESELPN